MSGPSTSYAERYDLRASPPGRVRHTDRKYARKSIARRICEHGGVGSECVEWAVSRSEPYLCKRHGGVEE